jgi:hypothetical protein
MSFSFFSIRAKGVSVGDYIFPAPFAVALDVYLKILQPLFISLFASEFCCWRVPIFHQHWDGMGQFEMRRQYSL